MPSLLVNLFRWFVRGLCLRSRAERNAVVAAQGEASIPSSSTRLLGQNPDSLEQGRSGDAAGFAGVMMGSSTRKTHGFAIFSLHPAAGRHRGVVRAGPVCRERPHLVAR